MVENIVISFFNENFIVKQNLPSIHINLPNRYNLLEFLLPMFMVFKFIMAKYNVSSVTF